MTAQCIISFDCEGKWGIADHISPQNEPYFTTQNLEFAYKRLLEQLDHHQIPATFAFVTAFTLSYDQYRAHQHDFRSVRVDDQIWLDRFFKDMATPHTEGWFAPNCLKWVQEAGLHEIASHGFTHLPLRETAIGLEDFVHEMTMIQKHGSLQNNPTFIYPRNHVGFVTELAKFGFVGYRDELWEPSYFTRPISLLNELRLFEASDTHAPKPKSGYPMAIPPGRFLNWRIGLRKHVPFRITVQRWKNMIEHAIANHQVIHLWTHPHNFIDGLDMFELFEAILTHLSQASRDNRIDIVTQQHYCKTHHVC